MARPAQAFDGWCRRLFLWFSPHALGCALTCFLLAGCGARGFSIEDAVPDRSLVTGSISPQASVSVDSVRLSDEITVRNAVSSAIVDEIGESGIGWANAGTGSRGAIQEIRETRANSYLCRRFVTSRESFDGIHLYRGETCLGSARDWVMKSFERIE